MDYEQKYKEALRKASKIHRDDEPEMQRYMEVLFPELKEPNDESIRKSLIKHFREYESCTFDGLTSAEVLRWLEKQCKKDVRQESLEDLLVADDIYQMAMNDAMVAEAKNKVINALQELLVSKILWN